MAKPTIHQVANHAGVSTTTVSRTINSPTLVEAETAEKVWAAISALEYYPNGQARSLVSGRTRLLGLIVSDITNPFFPEVIKGFEDVAAEQGYDILIGSTDYDPKKMADCVRRMLERRVDGVAILTSEMDHLLVDKLARRMLQRAEKLRLGNSHAQHRHLQPREPDPDGWRNPVFGQNALKHQCDDFNRRFFG